MEGELTNFKLVAQQLVQKCSPRLKLLKRLNFRHAAKRLSECAHKNGDSLVYAKPLVVHEQAKKLSREKPVPRFRQKLIDPADRVFKLLAFISSVKDLGGRAEIQPRGFGNRFRRLPVPAVEQHLVLRCAVIFNVQPAVCPKLVVAGVGVYRFYQSIHR